MATKTWTKNKLYDPFVEANGPTCDCCDPLAEWVCVAHRQWAVVEAVSRLPNGLLWLDELANWANLVDAEEAAFLAAESAAARAKRLAAEEALRQERLATCESSVMSAYADFQKSRNTVVIGKGRERETHLRKVGGPCKWLYCDEAAKKGGVAPLRNKLTGSQCWAWEYLDPKTKQWRRPHTCAHLHPGEEGWLPQWNTDRTFRPDRVAEGLAALRGVPAPRAAPRPAMRAADMAGGGGGAGGWTEVGRKERSAW